MAQDLRSRRAALSALVLLAACGQSPAPAPPPTPRAVDTTPLAPDTVVAAVLAECHAPLRGQMDRVGATVTFADGQVVQLFGELPLALRAQGPDGNFLLRGERAVRVDTGGSAVTATELERLRQLRRLLDVAAFGPLHRAQQAERTGPAAFRCRDATGAVTEFTLRPGTLLPSTFTVDGVSIAVTDYLRTPTTWIARQLDAPGLGRCVVRFDARQVAWDPALFLLPEAAAAQPTPTTPPAVRMPAGAGGEPRAVTPTLTTTAALRWALVRDPGDWPGRAAAYAPLHEELRRQQQAIPGFPVLFRDADGDWLAAPFRARPDGPAFAAPAGWRLRDVAAGRWLYVYPAAGDFAARRDAGERQLQDALAAQGLRARGPVTAQPFLHLQEGDPPPEKLAAPVVRVAVPVD